MHVNYREAISILQIIAFFPILILGLLLNLRHGFAKSSGWFFLITLSILRLIGAICWLVYYSDFTEGVAVTAVICENIGLAPLTLLCMGLLSRVNDFTTQQLDIRVLRYPSLFSLLGLILGIVGGVIAGNSSNPLHINDWTKVAVAIVTAVELVVIMILVVLLLRIRQVKLEERRILFVVTICTPFIVTRLVYTWICDFVDNSMFNYVYGNLTIELCMAVIEEIIVAVLCVIVGFALEVIPKADVVDHERISLEGIQSNDPNKLVSKPAGGTEVQRRSRSGGPITWLYTSIRDYIRSRKAHD